MTKETKKHKLGFTLLELLVVVLIIGILAAIALPQYQLAVDKSEFAKYQSIAASLRAAYNEYFMIHGKGTRRFEDLSFTIPSDFQNSYTSAAFNCVSNSTMFCCVSDYNSTHTASLNCGKNDLSIIYAESFFGLNGADTKKNGYCKALIKDGKENQRAKRLCSSLGTYTGKSNSWTPQGYSNNYANYELKL